MIMDSRLILFLIVSFIPVVLSSQEVEDSRVEQDYQKFNETLHKELNYTEKDSTHTSKNILHPAGLPAWFFNIPDSGLECIYTIGISEPGMSEQEAYELAKLRAKSLISLLYSAELNTMADHFINESVTEKASDFTTKYANFYRIQASIPFDTASFEIVNSGFTSFNEAIVLAKYVFTERPATDSLFVKADVYQVERQKGNEFEVEEKYEYLCRMLSPGDSSSFLYTIHTYNNIFEINSRFNNKSLTFPYFNFRYIQPDGIENQGQSMYQSKLNYGLWKSFLEVFLQELYFLSQNPDVSVKQVGDQYTNQTRNLARETAKMQNPVELRNLYITNNRIAMKLDILK